MAGALVEQAEKCPGQSFAKRRLEESLAYCALIALDFSRPSVCTDPLARLILVRPNLSPCPEIRGPPIAKQPGAAKPLPRVPNTILRTINPDCCAAFESSRDRS